jgi:hypothetical protein
MRSRNGITYERAPAGVPDGKREWHSDEGNKARTAKALLDDIHSEAERLGAKHVWIGDLVFEGTTAATAVWYLR